MSLVTKNFNPTPIFETEKILLRAMTKTDKSAVYKAISDPNIWALHPQKDRHTRAAFEPWFEAALASNAFVIIEKSAIDTQENEIIGSTRYYEIDKNLSHLSIGWTFLVCKHWGGDTNRLVKKMLLEYAYQTVSKVWLHIATDNIRSRRAAEKIGAILSHEGIKYGLPYCWYVAPLKINI